MKNYTEELTHIKDTLLDYCETEKQARAIEKYGFKKLCEVFFCNLENGYIGTHETDEKINACIDHYLFSENN